MKCPSQFLYNSFNLLQANVHDQFVCNTSTLAMDIAPSFKSNEVDVVPQSPYRRLPRSVLTLSSKSKRKATSLPAETVEYLKNWILSPEHISHPYPTEQEKGQIMEDTGIELKQLTNWFVNNRKRFWKPRVEARLRGQPKVRSTSEKLDEEEHENTVGDAVSGIITDGTVRTRSVSVSPYSSPSRHIISAQSSVVSETGSGSESSEEDVVSSTKKFVTRTETIQVSILRPILGVAKPSIEDITILPNIPGERTISKYDDCLLTYRCSTTDDSKTVSQFECPGFPFRWYLATLTNLFNTGPAKARC
jgi:hypothetical protein